MKPNIAYIVHTLNPGGTERLALEMGKIFSQRYNLSILCLDEPGQWAGEARDAGLPVYCLYRSPGIDLTVPVKLARFAREHRIDLFHAHQCTPWFYAGLSRLIYPIPRLLLEEHGRHYPEVRKFKKIIFNRFVLQHLTTAAAAVSKDIKQRLVEFEGLCAHKIDVIYNGTTPTDVYDGSEQERMRAALGFRQTDVIVGTVGRMDPVKNLPLFIKGVARARQSCSRLKGLIIGDGPVMNEVKRQVSDLALEDHVMLTGFRPDAAQLVRVMDIFCLVSFSEGTSMALLEAMAAGVPAIVTNVGGNPEIVLDRQTGWVVPTDDADAFTAVLQSAVKNHQMCREMGQNAAQRFGAHFSFDAMIENYRGLYNRMLER